MLLQVLLLLMLLLVLLCVHACCRYITTSHIIQHPTTITTVTTITTISVQGLHKRAVHHQHLCRTTTGGGEGGGEGHGGVLATAVG